MCAVTERVKSWHVVPVSGASLLEGFQLKKSNQLGLIVSLGSNRVIFWKKIISDSQLEYSRLQYTDIGCAHAFAG